MDAAVGDVTMAHLRLLVDDKCVETPWCIRPVVYQLVNQHGALLGYYCQHHARIGLKRLADAERENRVEEMTHVAFTARHNDL